MLQVKIQANFKFFDTDGSGSLSRPQLKELLTFLDDSRRVPTDEEIDFVLDRADTNKNGEIESDDELRACVALWCKQLFCTQKS